MKPYSIVWFLPTLLLLSEVQAQLDLKEVGCGSLVDGYLNDITSKSFSASSSSPGIPVISGKPWKPTSADSFRNLTVDLGQTCRVSKVIWAGDPSVKSTTSIMRLSYSNDGITYQCVKDARGSCKRFKTNIPPPVPGTHVIEVDLGTTIVARYFRFKPMKPNPLISPGSNNLRIDLNGCISVAQPMNFMFAMSATSPSGDTIFAAMKNTAKEIVNSYGTSTIKYSLVVFGSSAKRIMIKDRGNKTVVTSAIDNARRITTRPPNIYNTVIEIKNSFDYFDSIDLHRLPRVLVLMMEESSADSEVNLKFAASSLRYPGRLDFRGKAKSIQVIAVSFGRNISIHKLDLLTLNRLYVMMVSPQESPRHVGLDIMSRALKEIDITFAIGVNSVKNDTIFKLMKNTMKAIIKKYGVQTIHYSVVNYGSKRDSAVIEYSFTKFLSFGGKFNFLKAIESVKPILGSSGSLRVDEALKKSGQSFKDPKVRPSADKVIILMLDKTSKESRGYLKSISNGLESTGIRIIAVGIGKEIKRKELQAMTANYFDFINVDYNITSTILQEQIMNKVYRAKMPEVDLTFLIHESDVNASAYSYMQTIMQSIVMRYSQAQIQYSVIAFNDSKPFTVYKFGIVFPNKVILKNALSKIKEIKVSRPSLDKALQLAKTNYASPNVRSFALKVVVVMTSKPTGLSESVLRTSFSSLQDSGVRVIPVGIGKMVNDLEMNYITASSDQVLLMVPKVDFFDGSKIMNLIVRVPEIDVVFVLNADSTKSDTTFKLMQNTMKMIANKFGVARFHYAVVVYGGTSPTKTFDFSKTFPYKAAFVQKIDALTKLGGVSKITEALIQVQTVFQSPKARPNARKAVVIMQDKSSGLSLSQLKNITRPLFKEGMIVVGSGIGDEINLSEERALVIRDEDGFVVPINETAGSLADKIVSRILKDRFPRVNLVFALSLTAGSLSTQDIMKNIVKQVIQRFGTDRIQYAVILFGNTVKVEFDFDNTFPDQESILKAVKNLKIVDDGSNPNLQAAMDRSRKLFPNAAERVNARRVLVVLIDKTPSSSEQSLETSRHNLQNEGVTIIPVTIGSEIDTTPLYSSTVFRDHVTSINTGDASSKVAEDVMYKIPLPSIDLVFAMTADGTASRSINELMIYTALSIGAKYGRRKLRISLLTFGQVQKVWFNFNTTVPDYLQFDLAKVKKDIIKPLQSRPRKKKAAVEDGPGLRWAITKTKEIFEYSRVRHDSKKVFVIVTHQRFNISAIEIRRAVGPLDKAGIRIVAVGLTNATTNKELKHITRTERAIIRPSSKDRSIQVADEILKVIMNDGIPNVYLTFALSATGPDADRTLLKMKEEIAVIINRYDPTTKFHYSIIAFGQNSKTVIKFDPNKSKKELLAELNALDFPKDGPSLINVLKHTSRMFSDKIYNPIKKFKRAVILMWDKSSTENAADITEAAKTLISNNIRVIPVPMITNPVSAAEAVNPSKENIVSNDLASDPALVGEQIVDTLLSAPRCKVNQCKNGATCIFNICKCKKGFSGNSCEILDYKEGKWRAGKSQK